MNTNRAKEAALAFHAVAVAELTGLGRRASVNEIGRILGYSQGTYSRALRSNASFDTLDRWLERWAAAGMPRLCLTNDGHEVTVSRAEEVVRPG